MVAPKPIAGRTAGPTAMAGARRDGVRQRRAHGCTAAVEREVEHADDAERGDHGRREDTEGDDDRAGRVGAGGERVHRDEPERDEAEQVDRMPDAAAEAGA